MPQLKTAEQCLRLAADCRVAADAAEGENKGRWVQLATRWDALAQGLCHVEQIETIFAAARRT